MKRELIWDLHSKQKNRIWINLAFLRLGLIYEQHLWTCKTSRNVTNTLSMKGHPIRTRTWELMNMKIPLAGYHGYGIVTMIHNYQCENTSNEEFNLFKQKATEHWWRESCLWRMWRSTQWKWWKPCKGRRLPKRIQKKPICLQYICVNTCKVITPSQTAEMQQRWQHTANWAMPSLLYNMFTSLVSISSTQIIVVVVVA